MVSVCIIVIVMTISNSYQFKIFITTEYILNLLYNVMFINHCVVFKCVSALLLVSFLLPDHTNIKHNIKLRLLQVTNNITYTLILFVRSHRTIVCYML